MRRRERDAGLAAWTSVPGLLVGGEAGPHARREALPPVIHRLPLTRLR